MSEAARGPPGASPPGICDFDDLDKRMVSVIRPWIAGTKHVDAPNARTGGVKLNPTDSGDASIDNFASSVGGGGALGGTTITYGSAGKLQIEVNYAMSVDNAPAGFQTGFEAAIGYFTSTFTNNAKIPMNAGWGEVTFNGTSQMVT